MLNPSTTTRLPAGARHLAPGQRAELLELIRANPLETCSAIASMFEARTGRRVSDQTVRRAWVTGYRPAAPGDRNRNLTEPERMVLSGLCQILAPRHGRTEIARRFEAATGRGITPENVRKFLRVHLGITESSPPGRPRKAVTA